MNFFFWQIFPNLTCWPRWKNYKAWYDPFKTFLQIPYTGIFTVKTAFFKFFCCFVKLCNIYISYCKLNASVTITVNALHCSCHILSLIDKPLTERVHLHWCVCTTVSAAEKSVLHSSGQEQKCWRCFGDGLDVLFVVTGTIGEHQVIYDSHDTHEWQEEENAFPKQEARSAVRHTSRISVNKSGVCKIRLGYNTWLMCL